MQQLGVDEDAETGERDAPGKTCNIEAELRTGKLTYLSHLVSQSEDKDLFEIKQENYLEVDAGY